MFPKLVDFLSLLEEIAPSDLAETWDNPGLQVGSLSQEIRKIFVTLDPTPQAIRWALKSQAQVLLTHHPLIFKPISRLETGSYPGNVIAEAERSGISVVAAHTNLDVTKGGINDILAELLGLKNVRVLQEKEAEGMRFESRCEGKRPNGVGLGRIGDLPNPAALSSILEKVKQILKTERLRVVGDPSTPIRRVAVVAGSGGDLVSLAWKRNADLLLTGDVGHHHALEAEILGISVIDGGHFYTEKRPLSIFAKRLEKLMMKKNWEVKLELGDKESDPLNES